MKQISCLKVAGAANEPAAGEIAYGRDSFTRATPEAREAMLRRVGVLYQAGALFSSLTVAQNIEVPLREHLRMPEVLMDEIAACIDLVLKAAGTDLQHVLRCGVFLIDMKEFPKMNAVYQRMFGDHRPARTTIQAAALPGDGLRVEIDAIAYIP